MTPTPKGGGFSVQRDNHCCRSLKALPEPLNVSRRVLIPIQDKATRGADVSTDGETLLHPFPTAATVLAGVRGWHRYHSLAGACCLAFEDCTEARPPSILNRLIQASLRLAPLWIYPPWPSGLGSGR